MASVRFRTDPDPSGQSQAARFFAAADRRPRTARLLPAVVVALVAAAAILTGGLSSPFVPLLAVPLLVAVAVLDRPWWVPTAIAYAVANAVLFSLDASRSDLAGHIVAIVVECGLAVLIGVGAAHVAERSAVSRLAAEVAAAPNANAVGVALGRGLIGGGIVSATLAVVDAVPASTAEVIADVGQGAASTGVVFRVEPDDAFARAAAGGPVNVVPAERSLDEGARLAFERGYESQVVLPLGSVGDGRTLLVLSSSRSDGFPVRRLPALVRRFRPLGEAVAAHLLRRDHERRLAAAEAAQKLSLALATAPDVAAVLAAGTEGLRTLAGADGVAIIARDPERPEWLVSLAGDGPLRGHPAVDYTREASAVHQTMVRGVPIWIPDAAHSTIINPSAAPAGIDCALFVPLSVAGEMRAGVAISYSTPHVMPVHRMELLSAAATEVGVAWQRAEVEAQLREQATRDALTGLLNHAAFHGRLADAARTSRTRPVALVLADLDHLKHLNDTYGHRVGDEALRAVARVLTSAARAGDALGRLGGDEFAWLLEAATPDDALAAADRVVRAVNAVVVEPAGVISLSAGVAVAMPPTDPDRLLERADHALMTAKAEGRGLASIASVTDRRAEPTQSSSPEGTPDDLVDLDGAGRWLVREWVSMFRATAASLLLLDAAGTGLSVVAYHERGRDDWELHGEPYPLSEFPASAKALATGEVYACRADEEDADPAELREAQRDGFRSLMIVPLRVGSQPIGLVEVYDARLRTFGSDERRLAQGLGRTAALVLERMPR